MHLKALSVRQPWASYIACGLKSIEVRNRPWKYRGKLVICATKRPVITLEGFDHSLPRGKALAVVDLVDCRPLRQEDAKAAGLGRLSLRDCLGQWAWVLNNAQEVEPVLVRGQLQPWDWRGPELIPAKGWHARVYELGGG